MAPRRCVTDLLISEYGVRNAEGKFEIRIPKSEVIKEGE